MRITETHWVCHKIWSVLVHSSIICIKSFYAIQKILQLNCNADTFLIVYEDVPNEQ